MERSAIPARRVIGWCAFDFANSSYTTLITTVAFSRYFTLAVVGASNPNGDLLWSVAGILVNVALILTSPVFGAVADFSLPLLLQDPRPRPNGPLP